MIPSFLSGLLAGFFIGIAGQYGVKRFINNREQTAQEQQNKKMDWNKLFDEHPLFMSLIKTDVSDPENQNIREFFVVEQHALLNSSSPRLRYDLTDDNVAAVNKLEALGYIERLKNNCLLYKMREDFIVQLKSIN
ncbi:hypothetical protein [Legionella maioricensis]|uniref:Uncharacterized protein n=1 Tax=Legionella maioricensis TaxID=2896528 RepID=A0A9X2ID79_9GAMM|nr:hypothetical protein [Legionella maioricensis]MCL9684488.1 hypothetical protein [Legionella maioricensis]MCL9687918.1 hypothetical protein [Legionella maioricensis]